MRRRTRRHAILTWGILFGLLAGATGVSAWKFGWLPIDADDSDLNTLAGSDLDDASVSTDPFLAAGLTGANIEIDDVESIVFLNQAEPGILEAPGTPDFAAHRMPAERNPFSRQADDSTKEFTNRRQNSARNVRPDVRGSGVRRAAFESQPADRKIVQVSNTEPSDSNDTNPVQDQLRAIDSLIEKGDHAAAHGKLSKLYWNKPELRDSIKSRIETTARLIYFSPQPHYWDPYVIQPGDQLRVIAGKYRVPWNYLAKLNRIDARKIRPGQKLKVVNGPFAAVIDLSDYELTIHAHGYFVSKYRIGIGKDNSTPIGKFSVGNKVSNPQYTAPDGTVIASDDPQNPLGERWIDLGDSYGIHGTIEPKSIGRAVSRGCVRMRNADVAEVYDLLTVGSQVVIRR